MSDTVEAYKSIRIRTEIKDMLDELAHEFGLSRMAIVGLLIKSLYDNKKRLGAVISGISTKEFAELRQERIT